MCMCGFQFILLFFFHNHGKSILVAVMAVFQGNSIMSRQSSKALEHFRFTIWSSFTPLV